MQKLVLTYIESDDCTYSYEQTECFSYSSKEEAIADFTSSLTKSIRAFEDSRKVNEKISAEVSKFYELLNRTKEEDKPKVHRKIAELSGQRTSDNYDLSFGGKTYNIYPFYRKGHNGESDYIEDVRIQTLEEWFESKEG